MDKKQKRLLTKLNQFDIANLSTQDAIQLVSVKHDLRRLLDSSAIYEQGLRLCKKLQSQQESIA